MGCGNGGKHSSVSVGRYARGGRVRPRGKKKEAWDMDMWMPEYPGPDKAEMPGRVYTPKQMSIYRGLRKYGKGT